MNETLKQSCDDVLAAYRWFVDDTSVEAGEEATLAAAAVIDARLRRIGATLVEICDSLPNPQDHA